MIYSDGSFSYCSITGRLYHACDKGPGIRATDPVKIVKDDDGYLVVEHEGEWIRQHDLAFFLVCTSWPKKLAHRNGDRTDNRFANLKECGVKDDLRTIRPKKNNKKSGTNGVAWVPSKKRWSVRFRFAKRTIFLGEYSELEDAKAARQAGEALIDKKAYTVNQGVDFIAGGEGAPVRVSIKGIRSSRPGEAYG